MPATIYIIFYARNGIRDYHNFLSASHFILCTYDGEGMNLLNKIIIILKEMIF